MSNPWLDWVMLAAESQQVIALRMMKLAGGGAAAQAEAQRMAMEKITAMTEAGVKLMTGGDVVGLYRAKVRSNIRRLTR